MTTNFRAKAIHLTAAALAIAAASTASADDNRERGQSYEITITNLTAGQVFTPALLVTHTDDFALFHIGDAATAGLAYLAENGDPTMAQSEAASAMGVYRTAVDADGFIPPGHSRTVMVEARGHFDKVSIAGMLATTNDTFYAVNGAMLPRGGTHTIYAMAYDAGSEMNNELCSHIPGPPCDPMSGNAHVDEGDHTRFVHVSNGIHGVGDLMSADTDWRGPVAMIEIHRSR